MLYIFLKKYCILLCKEPFTFTDSIEPDQMYHYAVFLLGFTVCKCTRLEVSGLQRVNAYIRNVKCSHLKPADRTKINDGKKATSLSFTKFYNDTHYQVKRSALYNFIICWLYRKVY